VAARSVELSLQGQDNFVSDDRAFTVVYTTTARATSKFIVPFRQNNQPQIVNIQCRCGILLLVHVGTFDFVR